MQLIVVMHEGPDVVLNANEAQREDKSFIGYTSSVGAAGELYIYRQSTGTWINPVHKHKVFTIAPGLWKGVRYETDRATD